MFQDFGKEWRHRSRTKKEMLNKELEDLMNKEMENNTKKEKNAVKESIAE